MMRVPNRRAFLWTAIVVAALALHGVALWAVQIGLIRQVAVVPPVPVISVIRVVVRKAVAAPEPPAAPAPAPPAQAKVPAKPMQKPVPATALRHTPVVPVEPYALSERPVQTLQPSPESVPAVPAPSTEPVAAASAAQASPGLHAPEQASVVLPSADADYLHNPPPDYPPVSVLRGETGTVVVRVLIGVDGRAQTARVEKTSGYARLDEAALTTARDRWRYRPGTRAGVPEAMLFDAPITFTLR